MMRVQNEKHEQILDVADQLFSTRGYTSVRLRDIAAAIGLKHTALYYYAPGGKEQLFVEVMARSFDRHAQGMSEVIENAEPDLRSQLTAVANWLLSQPPLNIAHMEQSDFSAISEVNAQKLSLMIFDSLRLPLRDALQAAQVRGEISVVDVDLAALSFITLVESVHNSTNHYLASRKEGTIQDLIDMLMVGWLPR